MKKSYECDVATHIGPESCGAARKDFSGTTGLSDFPGPFIIGVCP
jgi:hypothetical protein